MPEVEHITSIAQLEQALERAQRYSTASPLDAFISISIDRVKRRESPDAPVYRIIISTLGGMVFSHIGSNSHSEALRTVSMVTELLAKVWAKQEDSNA